MIDDFKDKLQMLTYLYMNIYYV